MPRTSKNWPLTRTRMWRRCMAGGRKSSAMTPKPCARETSPLPWKTAKLWWSSWRKKHETDVERRSPAGHSRLAGHGCGLYELFPDRDGQCHAGKGLVADRGFLRHQRLAGHDL